MTEQKAPQTPVSDAKDWTWVTQRPCPECGFDPAALSPQDLPELINSVAQRFAVAVERKGAEKRPAPQTWSVIEYGRHVADVIEVMGQRLQLILDSEGDGPEFADWDQDAAAVEKEYWKSNAHATAVLIRERAEGAVKDWAEPEGEQWGWAGLRSNGSQFTAETLGLYFAHDLVHHLHDVSG